MKKGWSLLHTSVLCAALLMAVFIASVIYVALCPDFVPPQEAETEESQEDRGVWDKTYEELVAYLEERGFVDSENYALLTDGVASIARVYNDDIELYWWDLENLSEDSEEYQNYQSMQEEGYILLYGQFVFMPVMNGPFGMYIHPEYSDPDSLQEAFEKFPE